MILGPKFFHIYLTAPADIVEKLIPEVDKKGFQAIVVTCDDPTYRVRDKTVPIFMEASKYADPTILQTMVTPNVSMHDVSEDPNSKKIPVTWANIERLRKLTKLPIICKGILSPIDAEIAIKCGANGIVVRFVSIHPGKTISLLFSNHGSRLIDTVVPAIECLEDIINVVNGRAEG
jgi:isopentenyl diphosphate isomerase/L-lactate dehydrogenase-like FMN-dependent dehydrogenase